MAVTLPSIRYLFEPTSIAVIGASHDPSKIGYRVLDNIMSGGYAGDVFPVNPSGGTVLGKTLYSSMDTVPGDVDIAVIAIPAAHVYGALRDCAERGVKVAIIITSGFSEIGNSAEERRLVDFGRERGMRILGPNVFGIYSSTVSLNATFGPKDVVPGNVAIVSQSGAIGSAMVGKTKSENIGISSIVSVGNKADIDESDLLEYLLEDGTTRVVLMYIEGIRKGERLVNILKEASGKKPIIIIKSGRSKRGALAAASHTGSLAGADKVFDDIMRQCGVIRAESIREALEWSKYLAQTHPPRGDRAVIITNGGGIGVMCADACEKYNISLYDDTASLEQYFSSVIPSFGSFKNPVDLTGQASADNYRDAISAALKADDIHAIICLGCETAVFDAKAFAGVVDQSYKDAAKEKPLIYSIFGGEAVEDHIISLRHDNIPVFGDVYSAVSCMGALYSYSRLRSSRPETDEILSIDSAHISGVMQRAQAESRSFLLPGESRTIMKATGIALPRSLVARNLEECLEHAETIGYPVVLKIVSRDIIHKSDVGGIGLDLEDRDEVIEAYEAIMHNAHTRRPNAFIEGIEVSEMVKGGVETIVGGRRDPSFGPIVMFGLGGIYVEVMKDVAFRAFPIGRPEAMKMISEIRSYPLLMGVRGEAMKDVDAIADTIVRTGSLLSQFPEIADIEINPLVVYEQGGGARAVDIRILLTRQEVK
jgi:acetyl coenzyme A synthetase (ADP forming)-like protein